MVTGDQELQWAYLLCPTFELSNSEGKPLTNGYIELYIAGTRDKYYAASDFAGTLHPFQIPLDSLGSNIVLVSPDNAYDIYVYNRFGNLVMSRYNVVPTNGAAGGGSSSSNISIESGDGTVVVTESTDPETGVKTFDLSVPSVSGNPSFWTGRGAATMGVTISDTEYHKLDISNHSIRNRNDDITVVDGEFNLKKGVYFWNVTVQLDKYEGHDNTRQRVFIESGYNRGAYTMDMTHDETETISFSGITVADYDDTKQDIKIKSEGESPFKAVLYNVSIHKLNQNVLGDSSGGHTYLPGDYIEITEDDVINVTGLTTPEDVEAMIDAAITALASGDIYTGGDYINIDNHVISVTGLQPEGDYLTQEDLEGYATETYVDNSVSSFTTHTEVYNATVTAIEVATGAIPDTEDVTFKELDITQFAQASSIPVVTGFATRDEVYEAVVTGVQLATAQIPDQLEAGNYIDITNNTINVTGLQPEGDYLTAEDLEGYATEEYVTTYVDNSVSSFVTEEQVTAMFPETEDVEFEEINLNDYALASAIPDVSDFATHTEVYESTVTAVQLATAQIPDQLEAGDYVSIVNNTINVTGLQPEGDYATNADVHEATVTAIEHVTALIPEAQVQSDWTEVDTNDPSYIQHKPEEVRLVAGDNVTITETATSIIISASGGGPEYTAGANIYIDNNEIGVTDVIDIYARPESASGMIKLGNIAHWGNIDYGPGLYLRSTMDDDLDNRTFRWYITGDHGIENRFWGAYDDSRPDSSVSAESFIHIREGDIYYKRGEYQNVNTLPMIWSCSGMRYDIDRLQEAVTAIPAAQVQSDWTEVDTADPSYIQNKPAEKFLVGGDNVNITETATSVVVSVDGLQPAGNYATQADVYDATVTALETATGFIPDSEEVDFEELDLTQFAQASAIPTVQLNGDDQVTSINNYEIAGTGGTTYTAGEYISIENDEISVTGLEPLPEIVEMNALEIKAGNNITIVTGVSDITISVTGIEIPEVTGFATHTEVYNAVVTGVQTATGLIPELPDEEEVDFEEISLSDYALASAIPDVSNFVTDTEVTTEITEAVSGKQDMLTGITDVQVVTGLPVSPTQDVLYLIVEA